MAPDNTLPDLKKGLGISDLRIAYPCPHGFLSTLKTTGKKPSRPKN